MKKLLLVVAVLTVFISFGGVLVLAKSINPCDRAIWKIQKTQKRGDVPIARLLVEAAVEDVRGLSCTEEQVDLLEALQYDIYVKCIYKHLEVATQSLIDQHDGHSALRSIIQANKLAEMINVELKGIDGLNAVAFYFAAGQDLELAEVADKRGDTETRDELYAEADKFIKWAFALEPQLEAFVREMAKK